jgi:hypothetical protein
MKAILNLMGSVIILAGSISYGQAPPSLPVKLVVRGSVVDQAKNDDYERQETEEFFNWIQEFSKDQFFSNTKKGVSEVLGEAGNAVPAEVVRSVPLTPVDAWLSGSSFLSSKAGTLLPSEFLQGALPSILEAPVTGVIVGETFRSESTAPPRLDQVGPVAGITWQQQDTADVNSMTEAFARSRQSVVNQSNGFIQVISTISAHPVTLSASSKSISSPVFSQGNCAGGTGPTQGCK